MLLCMPFDLGVVWIHHPSGRSPVLVKSGCDRPIRRVCVRLNSVDKPRARAMTSLRHQMHTAMCDLRSNVCFHEIKTIYRRTRLDFVKGKFSIIHACSSPSSQRRLELILQLELIVYWRRFEFTISKVEKRIGRTIVDQFARSQLKTNLGGYRPARLTTQTCLGRSRWSTIETC